MLRVDTRGRSLVFSGDTGWHESLPEKVGDVDLFISECVFSPGVRVPPVARPAGARARALPLRGDPITHLGSQVLENESRVAFDTAHDGLTLSL